MKQAQKYIKKPVVIGAVQWDGSLSSYLEIKEIFPLLNTVMCYSGKEIVSFDIVTLEGVHVVSKDDFIIQGIKGEYYPCKPDIFELTYETFDGGL